MRRTLTSISHIDIGVTARHQRHTRSHMSPLFPVQAIEATLHFYAFRPAISLLRFPENVDTEIRRMPNVAFIFDSAARH